MLCSIRCHEDRRHIHRKSCQHHRRGLFACTKIPMQIVAVIAQAEDCDHPAASIQANTRGCPRAYSCRFTTQSRSGSSGLTTSMTNPRHPILLLLSLPMCCSHKHKIWLTILARPQTHRHWRHQDFSSAARSNKGSYQLKQKRNHSLMTLPWHVQHLDFPICKLDQMISPQRQVL